MITAFQIGLCICTTLVILFIVRRQRMIRNARRAIAFHGKTHGLLQPKFESKSERLSRIDAEYARQSGYSDGLHGGERSIDGAPALLIPYYERGYELGKSHHLIWSLGLLDGKDGTRNAAHANNPPYEIGYAEGLASK